MSRLSDLGDLDVLTEDGLREFTKRAVRLDKDFGNELRFAAEVLLPALSELPVAQARSGVLAVGSDSKAAARKVRAYLNRAAEAHLFAAGQTSGAWRAFEAAYLADAAKAKQPTFKLNRHTGGKRAS